MACYFIRIPCASSGTKRRTQWTEEPERKQPDAARLRRYYRLRRPVLPVQAVLPAPATGHPSRSPTKGQTTTVLPAQEPVLPVGGTTAPSYRSLQANPREAPGSPAVLPPSEWYYRLRPVLPVGRPLLPVL